MPCPHKPDWPRTFLRQNAGIGAAQTAGIDNRTGQPAVELGLGLGGVELLQNHLPMRPGQIEQAIGQMPIVVFLDESHVPHRAFP